MHLARAMNPTDEDLFDVGSTAGPCDENYRPAPGGLPGAQATRSLSKTSSSVATSWVRRYNATCTGGASDAS